MSGQPNPSRLGVKAHGHQEVNVFHLWGFSIYNTTQEMGIGRLISWSFRGAKAEDMGEGLSWEGPYRVLFRYTNP